MLMTRPAPEPERASLELADFAPPPNFARVVSPRAFEFPQDHGPHEEFQTEWWYYTGNLQADSGSEFGYQLTIFRRGLIAPRDGQETDHQIYFAHLALTDVEAEEHRAFERFSRTNMGLAGARGDPFSVHIEDWSVEGLDELGNRVRLRANEADFELDLTLEAAKPIVAHGADGYSLKGDLVGNASYYLSFTDMETEGVLTVRDQTFQVRGSSWFDHEFGTSSLGPETVGWDWFGLQLDDGRELMLYHFRRADGEIEAVSGGTVVQPDGSSRWMSVEEFSLKATSTWTSEATGATYPSGWEIAIPSEGLELEVHPRILDQEMQVNIVYWEGAVGISGSVAGQGYAELTGYLTSMQGLF